MSRKENRRVPSDAMQRGFRHVQQHGWPADQGQPLDNSRDASPVGDQIDSALVSDRTLLDGSLVEFSPGYSLFPRVREAVELSIHTPTTIPLARALLHQGLRYQHGNGPDRKPGKPVEKPTERQRKRFLRGLNNAIRGPVTREVVLYGDSALYYCPEMPGDAPGEGSGEPTLQAYPVPPGFSSERVARLAAETAKACYWCKHWSTAEATDFAMIITCGSTTRVFPTCTNCRLEFDHEEAEMSSSSDLLSWLFNDGWDREQGYPADRWR